MHRNAPDNYEAAKRIRRVHDKTYTSYDVGPQGKRYALESANTSGGIVAYAARRARAQVTHPGKRGRR